MKTRNVTTAKMNTSVLSDNDLTTKDNSQCFSPETQSTAQIKTKAKKLSYPKTHSFDFNPDELADIKNLFPEFKQTKTVNKNKIQGIKIEDLRNVLRERIKVPAELVDKSIARIDRQNDESVLWSEYLISMTEEGKCRETVADA